MSTVIIEAQMGSMGGWREMGRTTNDPMMIFNRMRQIEGRPGIGRIRARDSRTNAILDMIN